MHSSRFDPQGSRFFLMSNFFVNEKGSLLVCFGGA